MTTKQLNRLYRFHLKAELIDAPPGQSLQAEMTINEPTAGAALNVLKGFCLTNGRYRLTWRRGNFKTHELEWERKFPPA